LIISQVLPANDFNGNPLVDADYYYAKKSKHDVSVIFGIFGEGYRRASSMTITFKAVLGKYDPSHVLDTPIVGGGSAHSGVLQMYSSIKSVFSEYDELFGRLPQGFSVTFVGHGDGGALASMAALEFMEKYQKYQVTLLTINTAVKWDSAFNDRVDRAVKTVYRWQDVDSVTPGNGVNAAATNEIWYMNPDFKCCPQPETENCRKNRGVLNHQTNYNAHVAPLMTFHGMPFFGKDVCEHMLSSKDMSAEWLN
jgi:hypothetical protein